MKEFRTGRVNKKQIEEVHYFSTQEEAEQNARIRSLASANIVFLVQEKVDEDQDNEFATIGFYQDGEEMIGM